MPTRTHQPSPRRTHTLALLPARLTERDRELIRLVHEHHVFTTDQLAKIFFDSRDRAEERLRTLAELEVLDRFRPHREVGSAPYHYTLGPAGADVLVAEQETTPTELGYKRDRTLGIAHSQRLGHQLGVNGFFADLINHSRRHPEAELATWWSERQCATQWGRLVRPDAYARWHDHGREIDFFLEYDTGTEPLARLVDKLEGYTDLAIATDLHTLVLFWLPGPRRERGLHTVVGEATPEAYDRRRVPVATATARSSDHPAGPVWWPAGAPEARRRRLVDLGRPDPG